MARPTCASSWRTSAPTESSRSSRSTRCPPTSRPSGPRSPRRSPRAASQPAGFRFLYPAEASLREKIEAIATKIYGADGVDYAPLADRQLDGYERNGFGRLPVCIAKTQYSLSHDAGLKGAPTGFRLPVREVRASVGAGFIYPICGDMRTMPGLAGNPAAASIDLDDDGNIVGLY
ncbi:MAG TPA: formate--tetrahydrofolate ligase [Trebonia sp.]|nr:formate--tetrahydrofolate ligase [Trebonia sp.]